MLLYDARTARVLATIVWFGLALAFAYLAWRTLVTFLFAVLFAYLLEPVVVQIQARLRLGRAPAVGLLYCILAVGAGTFLYFLGPRIVQQADRLSQLAPQLSARIASGEVVRELGSRRGWAPETQQRVAAFVAAHRLQIAGWEQELLGEIARLARNATWVALIPILAIFFLIGGRRFAELGLQQLARRRERALLGSLMQDVHDVLAKYIRAQLTLTAFTMGAYLLGFVALRLPYAIALGFAAGALEFIPVVGPLTGFAIVLATAFLLAYPHLFWLLAFMGAWRLLQDYYNSPHIMGGQVQLHPLAVLFGIFAGAEIGGVLGVYLSIPILATLRVVWLRWRAVQSAEPPSNPS
ncbi:MAG: AI-2E family transporter [Terriglobales bacterium]